MAPNEKIPNWPEAAHANARRSLIAEDLLIDGDVTSDCPFDVHGKIVGSASAPEVDAMLRTDADRIERANEMGTSELH